MSKKLTFEEKIISAEKRKAYKKAYYALPETKARIKAYMKAYRVTPKQTARRKVYQAAYYALPETKARRKVYQAAYNALPETKALIKASHLSRTYNLTLEQYQEMYNKQDGKCAICKRPQSMFKREFDVDHNHTTGKIRGLLCTECNKHITGFDNLKNYFAGQNISIMRTIVEYLKNYNY